MSQPLKHHHPPHDDKIRIADLLAAQERPARVLAVQRRHRLDVRPRRLPRLGTAVLRIVEQRLERRVEADLARTLEVFGGRRVEELRGHAGDLKGR